MTPETDPPAPSEKSEIVEFFSGATVFLTGGTGFLGKLFLEKLLRTCHDLDKIYVLVRPKKGKDVQTRFEEIFQGPSFERLKSERPNFAKKVTMVSGDCSQPDVGLSPGDKETIISETSCIIHCAATVRFDQKLRSATDINVRSVVDIVEMAKNMKNLKAMLYISTAFSNSPRKHIEETFYPPPMSSAKLFSLLDALDDEQLDEITPTLLGEYPNTYVYTKAIAEDVVKTEAENLPIGVFRPAIVIPSLKDPVPGWIDNLYGATGVLLGAALGVIRSIHARKENTAELVPADFVVNGALASVWDIASRKDDIATVYNFVSSPEKKIDWGNFISLAEKHAKQVPTTLQVWHYFFALRSSRLGHLLAIFFLHTVPAYVLDFFCMCIGKKPMMVEGYKKINKFVEVIGYFSSRDWTFTNQNVQKLWQKMTSRDKELFQFSMKDFDWDAYFYVYVRGGRMYLLKDPLDTISKGRVKYYKLMVAHYALLGILGFVFYKFLVKFAGVVIEVVK